MVPRLSPEGGPSAPSTGKPLIPSNTEKQATSLAVLVAYLWSRTRSEWTLESATTESSPGLDYRPLLPCGVDLQCDPELAVFPVDRRNPDALDGYVGPAAKGARTWIRCPAELRAAWGVRFNFDAPIGRWIYTMLEGGKATRLPFGAADQATLHAASTVASSPAAGPCGIPWSQTPEYSLPTAPRVYIAMCSIPYNVVDWYLAGDPSNGTYQVFYRFMFGLSNNLVVLPVGGDFDWKSHVDDDLLRRTEYGALLAMMAADRLEQRVYSVGKCAALQANTYHCSDMYVGGREGVWGDQRSSHSLSVNFQEVQAILGGSFAAVAPPIPNAYTPSQTTLSNLVAPIIDNVFPQDEALADDKSFGSMGIWGESAVLGALCGTSHPFVAEGPAAYWTLDPFVTDQFYEFGTALDLDRDLEAAFTGPPTFLDSRSYPSRPSDELIFARAQELFIKYFGKQIAIFQTLAATDADFRRRIEQRICVSVGDMQTPAQIVAQVNAAAGWTGLGSRMFKNSRHDFETVMFDQRLGGSDGLG